MGQGDLGQHRKGQARSAPTAEEALNRLLLTVDVEQLYRCAPPSFQHPQLPAASSKLIKVLGKLRNASALSSTPQICQAHIPESWTSPGTAGYRRP